MVDPQLSTTAWIGIRAEIQVAADVKSRRYRIDQQGNNSSGPMVAMDGNLSAARDYRHAHSTFPIDVAGDKP